MKVHDWALSDRVFDVVNTARTARKPIEVGEGACPVIRPKVFCVTSEMGGEMVNPLSLTSKFWLFPKSRTRIKATEEGVLGTSQSNSPSLGVPEDTTLQVTPLLTE